MLQFRKFHLFECTAGHIRASSIQMGGTHSDSEMVGYYFNIKYAIRFYMTLYGKKEKEENQHCNLSTGCREREPCCLCEQTTAVSAGAVQPQR